MRTFLSLLLLMFALPAAAQDTRLDMMPLLALMGTDAPAPIQQLSTDERTCMAQMIYHEARGETLNGQIAVISVVLNRIDAMRWSDSICGNVGWPHAFSFVDAETKAIPATEEMEAWHVAWTLAGLITEPSPDLLEVDHYHTVNVDPYWNDVMDHVTTIGDHMFYTDPTTRFAGIPTTTPST